MGCGQSKIHLYPRKSKSKANGKKSGNVDLVDPDAEEDDEGHREAEKELNGNGKSQQQHHHHLRNEDDLSSEHDGKGGGGGAGDESGLNGEITIPMLRGKNLSLLQNQDISSSQQNFFKMLDQKIDEGPDYDSTSETEMALEEARLNALVQHWESASLTASMCSSTSRSLQSTPIRQSNQQSMRMQPTMPVEMLSKMQSLNSNVSMSPKRDQRILPQALMQQQQQQQGYNISMATAAGVALPQTLSLQHQQMLQQQQQQMAMQSMPGPAYMSQQYAAAAAAAGMMRVGPRILPVGGGNGVINSALPQSSATVGIPYYSQQHPSMMHHPGHQMTYSAGMPIPQANPNQTAAYYGDLMQHHPLQVPSTQQPVNPMMGYNSLITSGMGMSMDGAMVGDNKVFPAAISVQRLAPQVQRQIRETQELIKDSCPQLYGSPGPPQQLTVQPTGPPPPPQRMSTLRKNTAGNTAAAALANNNSSYETHSQEYS